MGEHRVAEGSRTKPDPVPFTARVPELLSQLRESYVAAAKVALPPPLDGSRMLRRAWVRTHVEAVLVWLSTTKTPQHTKDFREHVEAPLVALRKWESKASVAWRQARSVSRDDSVSIADAMKYQPPHAQWWIEMELAWKGGPCEALKFEYEEIRGTLEGAGAYLRALCVTLSDERARRAQDAVASKTASESVAQGGNLLGREALLGGPGTDQRTSHGSGADEAPQAASPRESTRPRQADTGGQASHVEIGPRLRSLHAAIEFALSKDLEPPSYGRLNDLLSVGAAGRSWSHTSISNGLRDLELYGILVRGGHPQRRRILQVLPVEQARIPPGAGGE